MNQNPLQSPEGIQSKIQPINRNITAKLPLSIEKSRRNHLLILVTIFLLVLIGLGLWFALSFMNRNRVRSNKEVVLGNKLSFIGVIRTSGLSPEEKQRFGLKISNFQIEVFGIDNSKGNAIYGYFLESSNNKIDSSLGKCVRLEGEKVEPLGYKPSDAYRRSVLTVQELIVLPFDKCSANGPYSSSLERVDSTGVQKITLQGIVSRMTRPSPDIFYDYELKLSKPFIDTFSSIGSPQELYSLTLVPGTNDHWEVVENNIGRELTMEGTIVWGYAESKYFGVIEIKNTTDQTSTNIKGWKTYTNPILYYSISYPSNFTISLDSNNNPPEMGINISNSAQTISISIYDPSGSLSGNASEKLTSISNLTFTINNKEYKPEEAFYFPSQKKYKFAGIHPYLKNGLTWGSAIGGSYSDEKDIDILKKIISTFTFLYPTLEVNQNSSTWKTYLPAYKGTYNTTDWNVFYEDYVSISYIFKYPSNWRAVGDTLFFGRDLIASIIGPIHLSPGQTCFENRKNSFGSFEISRENVRFGTLIGIRAVDKITSEPSKFSFNNIYCLSEDNKAIIISFHEIDSSNANRKLFEQILSTFKFQ